MKYVIDSCVGVKTGILEANSDKAIRLRDDFRAGIHELIAPDVYPVEIAHAITRAERQGRLTRAEGAAFLADILTLPPHYHASIALLARAYAISSQFRTGVYDCLYVSLGEREGCQLVTSDDKLLLRLGPHFPFIVALDTFPA